MILLSTIVAQLIILIYAKSFKKVTKTNIDGYLWPKKKLIKEPFLWIATCINYYFSWIVNEGDRLFNKLSWTIEVGFYSVAYGVIATPFVPLE